MEAMSLVEALNTPPQEHTAVTVTVDGQLQGMLPLFCTLLNSTLNLTSLIAVMTMLRSKLMMSKHGENVEVDFQVTMIEVIAQSYWYFAQIRLIIEEDSR